MIGGGRFGSDYRKRLAERQNALNKKKKIDAAKTQREKAFSSKQVKEDKNTFGKNYSQLNAGSLLGLGIDYFGNKILKPVIEKGQGDITEIPKIGKSPEGTLFGGLAIGSLLSPSNKSGTAKGVVKGLTSDSRIMQDAFEFTRDIAEQAQRVGEDALSPAERLIKNLQTRNFARASKEQLEGLSEILPNVSISPLLGKVWRGDLINAAEEAGRELPVFLSRGTRPITLLADESPVDLSLVRHFLEAGKLGLQTPFENIPKYDIGGMRIYRFNDPDMIKRANMVMRGEARGANKLYKMLTGMAGRVEQPYQFAVDEANTLRSALDETLGLPAPTISAIWSSAGELYPYASREAAGTIGALDKMKSKTKPIIEASLEDMLNISDEGRAARQTIIDFINGANNQLNISQALNALKSDIDFGSLSGTPIPSGTSRTTVDLLRGVLKEGSPLREVYEASDRAFEQTTKEAQDILRSKSPLNDLPYGTTKLLNKTAKSIRDKAKSGASAKDIDAALKELTDYVVNVGSKAKEQQPTITEIKAFMRNIEDRF